MAGVAHNSRRLEIGLAMAVLCLGVLVYLLDRSNASVYFIPDAWTLATETPSIFGTLGNYLPTFTHVFAFILFTHALLPRLRSSALAVVLAWFSVEVTFEIAQSGQIAAWIAAHTPAWFGNWPILENIPGYFLSGRFDVLDVVSIALGAGAAPNLTPFRPAVSALAAQPIKSLASTNFATRACRYCMWKTGPNPNRSDHTAAGCPRIHLSLQNGGRIVLIIIAIRKLKPLRDKQ